jgi:DNA gyrase subunit A
VVTITNSGYVKRVTVDTFRIQRRGGKGVSGGSLKDDEDFVSRMFTATNHQYLLCFTSSGQVHWLKVYDVPEAARTARGKHLVNVLNLAQGETISEIFPVREFRDDQFLLIVTAQGQVKKTALSAYGNPRAGGIKGIRLSEGDALVDVVVTSGNDEVLIASDDGQACRFHESDCRPMGRDTGGVIGIELTPGAKVVSLVKLEPGSEVLTICAKGYGKRTPYADYRLTKRGGKGVINIETSERNGPVVASLAVQPGEELMLMTRGGTVVRTRIDEIRTTGRAAQGVKVIGLDADDAVTGVARCPKDVGDEQPPAGGPPAG